MRATPRTDARIRPVASNTTENGAPEGGGGWTDRQIAKGKILFPGLLAAVTVAIAA